LLPCVFIKEKYMASAFTLLEDRIKVLEKEVGALKDLLNVYENWNSEIKTMFGKKVLIITTRGCSRVGKLIWSDRYCICLIDDVTKARKIYNKGGIESIELS
jgi:hypothetical protein